MAQSAFSLSWESHKNNICNGLSFLQQKGEFVDMTIAADGHHVKVHQMVMSLVSPFIKELITSAQCSHPIIFLNKVSHQTLQSILEYAYTGEVLVERERLPEFLEACNSLHIKGLETEGIRTADGSLLQDVGIKHIQESPMTLHKSSGLPAKGENKRMTDVSDMDNETMYDDGHIEDSHMDDHTSCDENDEETSLLIEAPVKHNTSKINAMQTSMMQYSLSCQGTIQLLLNRYIYYFRHARKNNEKLWRCKDYKKTCPAFVRTKDDIVIKRSCAHNHPFHDKEILKRVNKGNVYTTLKTIENLVALKKKNKVDDNDNAE